MKKPSMVAPTLIGLGFLVLVTTVAVVAIDTYSVDDFLKVWAVLGTLIGVVTGAIPAFFFSTASQRAEGNRALAEQRLQAVLAAGDQSALDTAAARQPELFSGYAGKPTEDRGDDDIRVPGPPEGDRERDSTAAEPAS